MIKREAMKPETLPIEPARVAESRDSGMTCALLHSRCRTEKNRTHGSTDLSDKVLITVIEEAIPYQARDSNKSISNWHVLFNNPWLSYSPVVLTFRSDDRVLSTEF